MKYFDAAGHRLVFIEHGASPSHWDNLWNVENFEKIVRNGIKNRLMTKTTLKFIRPDKSKKVLDGGCGNGRFVHAFNTLGYDSYGVDYAPKTISKIKTIFPDLKVNIGDVRKLDFPNNYFDGYWSIGVIEHFYNGYDSVIKEAKRVIKSGGFLFITFPHLSILRKIKITLGCYRLFNEKITVQGKFYQFALDRRSVIKEIEKYDFTLIQTAPHAGMKGLKDEISFFKPLLQKIYDSHNIILRIIAYGISITFSWFSGHTVLLIFRKQ